MTTTEQSAPVTLQPVPDEKNLLGQTPAAGACCGGSACGTN